MKVKVRVHGDVLAKAIEDLRRSHPFAAERVGFLVARPARSAAGIVLLVARYDAVPDTGYAHDLSAGAVMNELTILGAMQKAYGERVTIIHVHLHEHRGAPSFSSLDLRENARFVRSFINVRPEYPHGAVVLSHDSLVGRCWVPGRLKPTTIESFTIVGRHVRKIR